METVFRKKYYSSSLLGEGGVSKSEPLVQCIYIYIYLFLLTFPKDFPLFVRLRASKTEEDAAQICPMGLSGETVGLDLHKCYSVKSRLWWLKNKV